MLTTPKSLRWMLILPAWLLSASLVATPIVHAADGDSKTAAELLPMTVVAYADVGGFPKLLDVVLEHPLRPKVEASPIVKSVLESKDLQPALQLVGGFEASMGKPALDAIIELTDEGVSIAFDGASQGAILMLKCSNRDLLERFRGFVLALSQAGRGNFGVLPKSDYRGVTAYSVSEDLKLALIDDWLLVTNKPELGKSTIDRLLDDSVDSLADKPGFQAAMLSTDPCVARAYVDINTIRSAGVASDLYEGLTPNIAAEALFGGIMSNLKYTPYATATLDVDSDGLQLMLATRHQQQWEQGRESFFGDNGEGVAPPSLGLDDVLFSMRAHRDLSEVWLRAPDLMTEKGNDELAQADTGLTTLFSGMDFGEDVLGSLEPGFSLIVVASNFDDAAVVPSIRLPSFALEFRMRDPEATTKEFRRVFQSLVGFFNVVGAMNGQPQLDQRLEDDEETTMVVADYVLPKEFDESGPVPIIYNFSPTIAFSNDRMVLASSESLTRRMLAQTPADSTESSEEVNTIAELDAERLHEVLEQNREQLIAQNMLDNGNSPAQAKAEIGVFLDLVALLKDASVRLDVSDSEMKLLTEIHVKTP
ncbi:MAG: hypothetical protein AAF802_15885 [Planctomycetota bacterium]